MSATTPSSVRRFGKGKTAETVALLGERIVGGRFATDVPLPVEADLARDLNVGRSVLRESVKVLSGKGMLRARPRHGTFVNPRTQWDLLDRDVLGWMLGQDHLDPALLRDILVVRRIIEPEAAALAARNATPEDKAAIEAAHVEMCASVGDPTAAVAADNRFHAAVLSASHNMILQSFAPAIEAMLAAFFKLSIQNPKVFEGNLEAHGKVAAAIRANDPRRAFDDMIGVLATTEHDIERRLPVVL